MDILGVNRHLKRFIILFALTITLTSANFAYAMQANIELYGLITRKYLLGPNDVINISVYDASEFNSENVKIQPDGNIIIAPFGVITASGLTVDELCDIIVKKCKFYLKNPKVTIKLNKTKPFVVYVTGAVMNPGSFELNTESENTTNQTINVNMTRKTPLLSNVLVAAGGISFDSDLEHVSITNALTKETLEIDLLKLLEGDTSQDIYLMAYDTVNVPKLPTPFAVTDTKYKKYMNATFSPSKVPVKVYGYVNRPGLIFLDSSTSLNLNSAIAAAGGYLLDSAYAPENVYLSRADKSGKLVMVKLNPNNNDNVIMPNDIIYIPEKPRPMVGKAFDYMNRLIAPINGVSNTYNNWQLMYNPTRYQNIGR